MLSRRQEKVARVIQEGVSDIIANRLGDPRIEGFVSVTKVIPSPDLRNADVYISIMTAGDSVRRKTFEAIKHATRHIQMLLGRRMTSKFCPQLHFHEDAEFKNTLETLRMIDEAAKEFRNREGQDGEDMKSQ